MNLPEILENLKKYNLEIIQLLSSRDWDHFSSYFFIRERFSNTIIDDEFRRRFCRFYVLNGPTGLNKQQQDEFFQLLSEKDCDLEKILKNLYAVSNRHRLFLSFATKLLHTMNVNLPIYDRNISSVLGLSTPTYSKILEEKVRNRVEIYNELKRNFVEALGNSEMIDYLVRLRIDLQNKAENESFQWRDNLLSEAKLLDSVLWALYTVKGGQKPNK
ncbi:MAG: hypothetical protein Q7S83_02440 [bacterium]|nr:hypothetical protein [bacterium]